MWICIAPRWEHTSKALRYGTRSQGISQFYLHTPHSSANGMNHTCLCLPSRSWYLFTDPGGMEGWAGPEYLYTHNLTSRAEQRMNTIRTLSTAVIITHRGKYCECLRIKYVDLFTFSSKHKTTNSIVIGHGLLQSIQTRDYCLKITTRKTKQSHSDKNTNPKMLLRIFSSLSSQPRHSYLFTS